MFFQLKAITKLIKEGSPIPKKYKSNCQEKETNSDHSDIEKEEKNSTQVEPQQSCKEDNMDNAE